MAPKTSGGKKFYLVFWFPRTQSELGSVSIEPASKIPAAARFEGAITKLKWQEKGKKDEIYKVKVLKEDESKQNLEGIGVDRGTGEIIPEGTKAFSGEVLSARQGILAEKSDSQAAVKAQKRNSDCEVLSSSSIFDRQTAPKKKKGDGLTPVESTLESSPGVPQPSSESSLDPSPQLKIVLKHLKPILEAGSSSPAYDLVTQLVNEISKLQQSNEVELTSTFLMLLKDNMSPPIGKELQKPDLTKLLPADFFAHKAHKVQVFEDCPLYVESAVKAVIDLKTSGQMDWKLLTDTVLSEIYQDKIPWMSAKGKRGSVGIHPTLYSTLFAKSKVLSDAESKLIGKDLTFCEMQFTAHINHLISNRKARYRRAKKEQECGVSAPLNDTVDAIEGSFQTNNQEDSNKHSNQGKDTDHSTVDALEGSSHTNNQVDNNNEDFIQSTDTDHCTHGLKYEPHDKHDTTETHVRDPEANSNTSPLVGCPVTSEQMISAAVSFSCSGMDDITCHDLSKENRNPWCPDQEAEFLPRHYSDSFQHSRYSSTLASPSLSGSFPQGNCPSKNFTAVSENQPSSLASPSPHELLPLNNLKFPTLSELDLNNPAHKRLSEALHLLAEQQRAQSS